MWTLARARRIGIGVVNEERANRTTLGAQNASSSDQPLGLNTLARKTIRETTVIEETARPDEWYAPIPLKHLAFGQMEGSR
jgi:hypothetical protein